MSERTISPEEKKALQADKRNKVLTGQTVNK
jgi:hypothetical protein